MAYAYYSAIIAADIGKVWRVVRDFGKVNEWFPGIEKCNLENGSLGDQVGAVRAIKFQGLDFLIKEKLLELSDLSHQFVYTVVEGLDHKNYVSTIRLTAVQADDSTLIEWSARFDPVDQSTAATHEQAIVGAFKVGVKNLAANV